MKRWLKVQIIGARDATITMYDHEHHRVVICIIFAFGTTANILVGKHERLLVERLLVAWAPWVLSLIL